MPVTPWGAEIPDKGPRKTSTHPSGRGRPLGTGTYTPEIGAAICRLLTGEDNDGIPMTMPKACEMVGYTYGIVDAWLDHNPDFKMIYDKSRRIRAEVEFERIQEIADNGTNDYMRRHKSEGYRLNGEAVARSTLRVNTLKWRLSKMLPKLYGDAAGLIEKEDPLSLAAKIREIANQMERSTQGEGE